MASGRRLAQLRALVDRLERLPVSTRRDWMLQEARSRMVDVETGDEPRPLRTHEEQPPERLPERPGAGAGNGRAVKRPRSRPTPVAKPLPEVPAEQAPPSVPSPSRIAETDEKSPATFGTDELLWLEEPSGDPPAEPGDGSAELPPWRRGLRG